MSTTIDYHQEAMKLLRRPQNRTTTSQLWLLLLTSASTILSAIGEQVAEPQPTSWTLTDDSWNLWWSYSGVSGPAYWGLLNPDWSMCDKGRRQSPINIDTRALIYDPRLEALRLSIDSDLQLISGILYNDGHSIVFNASATLARYSFAAVVETTSSAPEVAANNVSRRRRRGVDLGVDKKEEPLFTLDFLANDKLQMLTSAAGAVDHMLESASSSSLFADEQQATSASVDQELDGTQFLAPPTPPTTSAYLSGAGLAYSYKFEAWQLKFGDLKAGGGGGGSEHQINGRSFAAELQLFAYNWHLYKSYQEAASRPNGLLAVAILIDLSTPASNSEPNEQLERILESASESLAFRGQHLPINNFNLSALLASSSTEQFVTYEGSLSVPGCHESVTWLLLNRPLYVSPQSFDRLKILSGDEQTAPNSSGIRLANNNRPIQANNNRLVRTNIRPSMASSNEATGDQKASQTCPRLWMRYEYVQSAAQQ